MDYGLNGDNVLLQVYFINIANIINLAPVIPTP